MTAWAGDEMQGLWRLCWELHAICPPVRLLCRPPTDGDQMKLVDFYSLQETLDSIRPHRQQIQTFIGPKNGPVWLFWCQWKQLNGVLLKIVVIRFLLVLVVFCTRRWNFHLSKNDKVHISDGFYCWGISHINPKLFPTADNQTCRAGVLNWSHSGTHIFPLVINCDPLSGFWPLFTFNEQKSTFWISPGYIYTLPSYLLTTETWSERQSNDSYHGYG